MEKHTKGPWESEAAADRDGKWHEILGDVLPDRGGVVADTLNRDHLISPDEDMANARLIASAPDLLAACVMAAETYECLVRDPPKLAPDGLIVAELASLRAAIAKATGEAPT